MPGQLVTVARYRDLPEALLAHGMLQAAGIMCQLVDENIVRMDWFWSNLVGGVRLQVREDEVNDAIEVLASPIPTDLPGETETFHQPACPKCGSLDVSHDTTNQWISAAVLWAVALPVPLPRSKSCHCWDCGASWVVEAESDS